MLMNCYTTLLVISLLRSGVVSGEVHKSPSRIKSKTDLFRDDWRRDSILRPRPKQSDEDELVEASDDSLNSLRVAGKWTKEKRRFDSIDSMDAFGDLTKRRFDSIDSMDAFGDLSKRRFDSIDSMDSFGDLSKRRFDSIDAVDTFADLDKRRFDSIDSMDAFGDLSKRRFGSIKGLHGFKGLSKGRGDNSGRQQQHHNGNQNKFGHSGL